jgi:4a-hydroxytetrahydrobiopterin dehydratase
MALAQDEIKTRLRRMHGWKFDGAEIEKSYKFRDFKEAMMFVNVVARAAEAMNHHPEIEIHYNRVEIALSTHSAGGITDKDFTLAGQIDNAAAGVAV